MNGDVETEAARPRPLSGGLWTLFSWLRRDDASSSESLSSAGSDRTVASFAFLPPARCRRPAPLVLPPPGPPTDSYKKRVHDRNLRRQHDRDLTLHRKYGLYRDITVGYDVTSLPSARRSALSNTDKQERERRATSESLQRRTAYVPGKRRAPPPPARQSPGACATLPQRQSRKRRAPQPPIKLKENTRENHGCAQNTEMNPKPSTETKTTTIDISMGCKSEKYVKKEQRTSTEIKSKQEKSFLKQIFDSKKRKSAIETSSIKILPSISELDKQAAELIELYKSKERDNNILKMQQEQKECTSNLQVTKRARWICITCLRRFDVSVNRCSFCLSSQKPVNNVKENYRNESIHTQTDKDLNVPTTRKHLENNERQNLKKMLKEMKDSLPKKQNPPKGIVQNDELAGSSKGIESITETPTLRIGSSRPQTQNSAMARGFDLEPSAFVKDDLKSSKRDSTNEIDKKYILHDNVKLREGYLTKEATDAEKKLPSDDNVTGTEDHSNTKANLDLSEPTNLSSNRRLHTPLKISSLLNPVYIPKSHAEIAQPKASSGSPKTGNKIVDNDKNIRTDKVRSQSKITLPVAPSTSNMPDLLSKLENRRDIQKKISPPKQFGESSGLVKTTVTTESQTSAVSRKSVTSKVDEINQHSRRRDLINQLENSIAQGNERAAADAAAKLAQLRLSCSVLSFTSQILGQQSNDNGASQKTTKDNGDKNDKIQQTEPHAIIAKSIVVPTTSKDTNRIIERKHEISKNDANKIRAEKSEPSCSKTSTEKANHIETFKIDAESSQKVSDEDGSMISISVWVEDKNATRGPIRLAVPRGARLGALRRRAEAALGVPARLQRWVVGRALCADDRAPLRALAGPLLDAPFYLCLVDDTHRKSTSPIKDGNINSTGQNNNNVLPKNDNDKTGDVYTELMLLERQALVPNTDTFECQVCMEECTAGNGVVLRECVHTFCRNCLADMIRHCEEPTVSCPAMGCPGTFHEREIRALVSPEEYEKWLARGLAAAESGTRNAFHCRTRDCKGWALCEAGVQKFPCPVCKRNNCLSCQAIHEGETCEQYRSKLQEADNKIPNQTDEGTKALLDSLISRGEALECPECNAIITKKWGCDWVKCSACKTEICWVTRGRRWGPAGRGDTSAGCRCGVDGKRCHPSCGYCH